MHVHTTTTLTPDEVRGRFEAFGTSDLKESSSSRPLLYARDQRPPKFFLAGAPVTPPAAAEVSIREHSWGTDVTLRLMWGPLPAPFPRALAGAGVLSGLLLAIFGDGSVGAWAASVLIAVLPGAALLYQQKGEQELQSQLSRLVEGTGFTPTPH